jgi:hypothetical protein
MSAKDAVYRLAHGYPGGVVALAARMGISPNTLQHKVNPHADGHHTYIEDAEAMTVFSQDPQVAQSLALACGHVCLPVAKTGRGELAFEIAAVGKEFGDVMAATLKALEDGKVTNRELAEFDKQFQEHLAAVIRLRGELVARIPVMPEHLKVAK